MENGVKKSKETKRFEVYLSKIINKYIPILFLQRHTFTVNYGVFDKDSLFECGFNYPYLNAHIRYSNKALKDWQEGEDLTEFVVHEMCHIITDPLYAKATQRYTSLDEIRHERELLTDYICNIVIEDKKGRR